MSNQALSTAVRQAMVVVAKNEFVVAQPVNYGLGFTNQPELVVIDAVVAGDKEYATRVNALQAVVFSIEAVDYEYDNFYSVFAPGAVADRIKDSVRWIQLFKKAVRIENQNAEAEGREATDIKAIKVPVMMGKKKETIVVTATEIELWAELHRQLGEKPFISVSNSKYASVAFRDKRAALTDQMVNKAYEALRDLGAEIKELESKEVEQTFSLADLIANKSVEDDHGKAI